jgi:hypothetical protein
VGRGIGATRLVAFVDLRENGGVWCEVEVEGRTADLDFAKEKKRRGEMELCSAEMCAAYLQQVHAYVSRTANINYRHPVRILSSTSVTQAMDTEMQRYCGTSRMYEPLTS